MQLHKSIKRIGVIGGGSAGYFSALYLKKLFPDIAVSIIESSKIPVIGVGEATTPLLLDFLHSKLGFPVPEFVEQAKPTIKLGVKFVWGKTGDYHYNNPFGEVDICNAFYHTKNFNNMSLAALLMDEGKAPFISQDGKIVPIKLPRGYAYHIDNKHFLKYLHGKLAVSGCNLIDAEIKHVHLAPDGNTIDSLESSTGELYHFDLLIDCSGFGSILLNKTLKTKWVDYSGTLKTNRAIVGTRINNGEIEPYTTATTLNHGWLWNTPTQHENHLGYVYAKEYCSDDEAFAELKQHCQTINNERIINFKSGRYENSWIGNVVAIGNSFAFIEPLESTGLHLIIRQLKILGNNLKNNINFSHAQEKYNLKVNTMWDNLKCFIGMHFKFNHKLNTPFWLHCRQETDLSGVQEYLDYYQRNGPLFYNKEHPLYDIMNRDAVFAVFSYDLNMAGCGVNMAYFNKRNDRVNNAWPRQLKFNQMLANKALGHREALKYMEQNACQFIIDWAK